MKLYYWLRDWQLPGQQDKGASRVEVPTDAAGLCAWLNERRVPICLPLHQPEPEPELTTAYTGPLAPAPQPCAVAQSLSIDDAWEALPLARKLHFAALAMEDARKQL